MQPREFKFLMGGNKEITLDDLRALIFDNEISNFDPVAEAFKVRWLLAGVEPQHAPQSPSPHVLSHMVVAVVDVTAKHRCMTLMELALLTPSP